MSDNSSQRWLTETSTELAMHPTGIYYHKHILVPVPNPNYKSTEEDRKETLRKNPSLAKLLKYPALRKQLEFHGIDI